VVDADPWPIPGRPDTRCGRLHIFPGNGHGLDKVEAEWTCFALAAQFLAQHGGAPLA